MKYKILIIGCGNIGYRYIQAILASNLKIDLYLSDKNKSLITKLIILNSKKNINIFSLSKKNKNKKFDLCIISTNSDVRLKVLKKTLEKFVIKKFILEKFLCQSLGDLNNFLKLKNKYNFIAWISCHRSLWKSYINLKKKIITKNMNNFSFSIKGLNWGIGCNSIHFMHLVNFLFGFQNYKKSKFEIKKKIKWEKSRRKNFFDFSGKIKFLLNNNSKLIFEDCITNNKKMKYEIVIKYNNKIIEIDELNNKLVIDNNKFYKFKLELVSEIYKKEINKILIFKKSNLPTLDETFNVHHFFIKNLLIDWNKFNKLQSNNILPIT